MRRLSLLLLTCASLASTVGFAGVADAAPSRTYTVTRTVGPYSGTAREGDIGFPQTNGEADVVLCHKGDTAVRGHATINHKTRHGTTKRDVLRLGRSGVTSTASPGTASSTSSSARTVARAGTASPSPSPAGAADTARLVRAS